MTPLPTRTRRRIALGLAAVLGAAGLNAVATSAAYAAPGCDVQYTTNDWPGGFTGRVIIKNPGDPISGWTLKWKFPTTTQKVVNGWQARWSQSGQDVTATNESYNGTIPTGGQVEIGFNGSWSGTNPKPTEFSVNGLTCGGTANPPPTVDITAPTSGQSFTAPADITVAATAADTAPGTVSKVEFYRNGLLVGEDTSAPYSFAQTSLPVGTYVLGAKATDNTGLSATDEVTVTVAAPAGPAVVTSPAAVSVPEGSFADVAVKLSQAPSSNVTVTATGSGDADVTATPTTFTFTTSNWNTAQNFRISAAEDSDSLNGVKTFTLAGTGVASTAVTATESDNEVSDYVRLFREQYQKIKTAGYFSPEGVPYHSIETLIVEAPDHGHETTSEAFSYWLWLEAYYGRIEGDWAPFNQAWTIMEKYIIPSSADQPTAGVAGDAQYASEYNWPDQYPSALNASVPVGKDPLRSELQSTYGTGDVYGMHWLIDVDNTYKFGRCGNGTTRPAYINTFQRGPQESVWETVPHPSCENFNFGATGSGYLPLFIKESGTSAKQWRYTNAPDADARAVEAAYWALTWATEQGKAADVAATVAKAAKMGDYLRYAMFDKYFKKVGNCTSPTSCPAGSGRDAAHYLMSWYYAWGGALDTSAAWSWRIGSSHNHFGYQNPMAAWALSNVAALKPRSSTAVADWTKSFQRQMEFYLWLQSAEGGIAGGATNSWEGAYGAPPSGTATFYGMAYDEKPVYHDPPSNEWFGFQAWSMHRIAELYFQTGDANAKKLLDKWVPWAISETTIGSNWSIPSTMAWSGQPTSYSGATGGPGANANLHVDVVATGRDVGVAASLARTLMFYAAKSGDASAKATAKGLLDALTSHADTKGVSTTETREDYKRFDDVFNSSTRQGLYVPSGYSGKMPNGDVIAPGKSFLDIRSFYKTDPEWAKVQAYLDGGPAPTFNYHRFWAQADIAMAYADYAKLFPNG
ncbi:cellulose 1,4-beta-cellobiosidase [Virgisporangium aliadipatigenens]|uniref:Cellulose 1,4-beta-cellobiosidase n=1 Tax=Virgisporangium aliadipatigenens TaxID=741659 RepID=A0A8J3YRR1_9ACTN|nr:glycoside hydrolase family 48 protein [Virgisporangium aliadipatigenens]GIJ48735.1 cellulose 1,4-beta-cellobiosidase [Virgisporangium aliadipatigenens]